ncbi:MAG: PFL family protein [Clostridia bacterium]|nr:PFL family protein [Clostridia bacterium]
MEVNEILQTMQMIREQHFDIRTITMGISLLNCKKNTDRETAEAVYEKVTSKAKNLVRVGCELESELGVPIVNKRISVTPVSMISGNDPLPIAIALDKAAQEVGVNFIGGFGALMHKGSTRAEEILLEAMPEVFAKTERLCGSVNVGSTRSGINMDAVRKMGHVIKKTAELTADTDGFGCAKIVVFCNAVEDNPFMAGAFHGVGEPEVVVNVGVSGPGVVERALKEVRGETFDVVAETIKRTAFKITRVGELVAQEAAARLGVPFGIVDLSLAPTPARGDSVAYILSEMGLEMTGAPGTTAALAMLNDMVKKGGVMASSHVGGLSGAFIPVSEDIGMIEAAAAGCLRLEKMEAMTCVCSVGLDMIAIPGDTSANTIAGIIADEAAIGMVNNKTTAVRVIPAPGKKAGDTVNFGGLFGFAPIMEVNGYKNDAFIQRGGRIPAPLHSLRN